MFRLETFQEYLYLKKRGGGRRGNYYYSNTNESLVENTSSDIRYRLIVVHTRFLLIQFDFNSIHNHFWSHRDPKSILVTPSVTFLNLVNNMNLINYIKTDLE